MEKLVYNIKTQCRIVLNEDYKVMSNIVSDYKLIKDIDFNNLPINVLNNIELFLGKDYKVYNINLEEIKIEMIREKFKLSICTYLYLSYCLTNHL